MKKWIQYFLAACNLVILSPAFAQNTAYILTKGDVSFHSSAPNELIYATSDKLEGVVDNKNFFLFKIQIVSFKGFNNQVQREHFNENYMESSIYPYAVYKGKIIEEIDLNKDGEYDVRAKGKLLIHGVGQERIIMVHIVVKDEQITVKSAFKIMLSDYNIKIPRIVSDKLSPDIDVLVNCTMVAKK